MATQKRKSKSFRKNKNSSRVAVKILSGATLILVAVIIGVVGYQYRNGFLYYLGFKTNKKTILTKKERQLVDIHIYEVLNTHKKHVAGIDISEYQEEIDWDNLGDIEDVFKINFVYIRATAGSNRIDKMFKSNWDKCTKNNIIKGAYHYYRPNENSIEQANLFINTVTLKKGDLPPVLDIEQLPKVQSIDSLKLGLKRWLTQIENHYKMKPIIYSGESYYTDFLKKDFSEYQFWIANYNLWQKNPENNWLMWQFTDKAKINGINATVDVNLLNGDFIRLVELTKK